MSHDDLTPPGTAQLEMVLRECAEVPLDAGDEELAAIALAIHVEEAVGEALPSDLLRPEALIPLEARERTVRRLMGGT